jgi:hypothetical protein
MPLIVCYVSVPKQIDDPRPAERTLHNSSQNPRTYIFLIRSRIEACFAGGPQSTKWFTCTSLKKTCISVNNCRHILLFTVPKRQRSNEQGRIKIRPISSPLSSARGASSPHCGNWQRLLPPSRHEHHASPSAHKPVPAG